MSDSRELPLFPVNTVLFPGQALSLHIFEERYKLMINRCLENDQPVGIVLIREGEEVGEPATPHDVGTLAAILETDRHETGEIDIIAVGQERFVIHQLLQERPYIVGQVEPLLPKGEDTPRSLALSMRASELLPKYVRVLAQATGTLVQVVNAPEEPSAVAFLVALTLQIEHSERQGLLATPDIGEMLAQEVTLLRREITIFGHMISTQSTHKEEDHNLFGHISLN
jgi:Lon protease-like protein